MSNVPTAELSARRTAVIIAFACDPCSGSEAGAGWVWTEAASRVANVTLITNQRAEANVQAAIRRGNLPINVRVVKVPALLSARVRRFARSLSSLEYCVWQALAAKEVRRIEATSHVDVVHHVTFASDSLPSALLASRAPVRIWGPVGGTARVVPGLVRFFTAKGAAKEVGRLISKAVLGPTAGALVARHATTVLALNGDVAQHLTRYNGYIRVESNVALVREELATARQTRPRLASEREGLSDPCQRVAVFAGRLEDFKGLLLAIESLKSATGWRLIIFGEGGAKEKAVQRAKRLGVVDRLEFRGQVARRELIAAFREADAVIFVGFHDSAGWTAGEAAATGCPVVCLDIGGPALQAGRNAVVVSARPARTLAQRVGQALEGVRGRLQPVNHLDAGRLPELLEELYRGTGTEAEGMKLWLT